GYRELGIGSKLAQPPLTGSIWTSGCVRTRSGGRVPAAPVERRTSGQCAIEFVRLDEGAAPAALLRRILEPLRGAEDAAMRRVERERVHDDRIRLSGRDPG